MSVKRTFPNKPYKTGITKYLQLLGEIPDEEFAKLAGCSKGYVYHLRRAAGRLCKRSGCLTGSTYDWERFSKFFGNTEDEEIAELVGCTLLTAQKQRRRRKIPPFFHPRECACGNTFTPRQKNHKWCDVLCEKIHWHYRRTMGLPRIDALNKTREWGDRSRASEKTKTHP